MSHFYNSCRLTTCIEYEREFKRMIIMMGFSKYQLNNYFISQARNLDQKRKWCQEIKRLILESYKEKIPEKVKGLVMQLGKSKQEGM